MKKEKARTKSSPLDKDRWRWGIYALLAVIGCSLVLGRIARVQADHGRTPFLSANDRSRWSTIRSLVDEGTFELDRVIVRPDGKWNKDWHSIDLVRHRGKDGKEHYYSSKPPLLTVLLAAEYWVVQKVTGARLADKPLYVGRLMIALTNIPLFALYLLLLLWVLEEYAQTTTAKLFVFAAAIFGTAVTPFLVSLSNHLPAAVAALGVLVLSLRIGRVERLRWWEFVATGFLAACCVVCELPALSIFPFVFLLLAWRSIPITAVTFVPTSVAVLAIAAGTNYWAHGTFSPAYGHRKDGKQIGVIEKGLVPATATETSPVSAELLARLRTETKLELSEATELLPGGESRWIVWDEATQQRFALVAPDRDATHFKDNSSWRLRAWHNWYDYPGSYWITERQGVDQGESSRARYLFQLLFGHHGLFSLTPLWLLALYGGWLAWREGTALRWVAFVSLCLFVICVGFYVSRPLIDRNYGGVSCTFRWLMWQIPLWLVMMIPAVDKLLARTWGLYLCGMLLAISIFAAEYNANNPWQHPWIYDYWQQLGWIE